MTASARRVPWMNGCEHPDPQLAARSKATWNHGAFTVEACADVRDDALLAIVRCACILSCGRVTRMRKVVFIFFIVLGVAVGLFASLNGELGLKIVMMGLGALFGTAIGGSVYSRGRRASRSMLLADSATGLGDPESEKMKN